MADVEKYWKTDTSIKFQWQKIPKNKQEYYISMEENTGMSKNTVKITSIIIISMAENTRKQTRVLWFSVEKYKKSNKIIILQYKEIKNKGHRADKKLKFIQ